MKYKNLIFFKKGSDDDSDSEGIDPTSSRNKQHTANNRNNINVSYGTISGKDSPQQIDPFEKQANSHDSYYSKRRGYNR